MGVLGESAFRNLSCSAMVLAGPDPGTGASAQKKLLQEVLKTNLKLGGVEYLSVKQITKEIEENYLQRWSGALKDTSTCPRPERTARAIASHLLDAGLSSDFLHRWWTFKIRYEKGERSLAEVVADAHALVREAPREYRGCFTTGYKGLR